MGNGMCSRRHKRIFQSLVLLSVVFGLLYGAMISYEMHKQLKRTEVIAVKYQQHQESLSAQLQGIVLTYYRLVWVFPYYEFIFFVCDFSSHLYIRKLITV